MPVNDSLTLTDEDGFGLDVASGDAFTILGTPSSTFMTINLGGDISADREAFDISHQGTGDISLTTSGSVTSDTEEAFSIVHSGAGDVTVTTGGTVTASAAARSSIVVNQSGSGNIALNINSSIVGGSSANAVALSTASGSATITLGAGASFTRGIDVSGVAGAANIEIGGTGDRSFDISDIPAITGDINFDKNGDETLTVTGTHASGAAFASTNVNAGELVWEGATFRTTNLAVANGATLGIIDNSSFSGASVTLSGRLELAGNSANFAVETLAGDGDIDIDVDFSGGDTELSNARLTATSVADTFLVNIRAIGGFPEIDESDEDGAITLENFIVADDQAFETGDALDNGNFHFDLVYDTGESRWDLIARPGRTRGAVPGSIEEALFESFPATLARFASLESLQQRTRGKATASNIKGAGAWGKASRSSRKVEPNSTALATFEIDNTAAQFGVDMPLHNAFTFGASVGFGDVTTDVAVAGTRADIDTSAITAGISANWKRDRIYIDTQLQYTTFDNTFKLQDAQGTQVASPDADAIAAGIELGYAIDLGDLSGGALGGLGGIGDITLTPFAQLAWTSVDFDELAGAATPVSLDDGDVLFGRIGAAAASKYLYGSASLQIPLDGETGVKVDGAAFTSEIEDVAFDVGVGFTYPLTENGITLDGAVETTQGGETEAYNANLTVRFNF